MQICPYMAILWASTDPNEPLWFYCDFHSSRLLLDLAFGFATDPDPAFQTDVDPLGSGSGSASLAAVKGQIKRMLHFICLFHGPFKRSFCFKVLYGFFYSLRHILLEWKTFWHTEWTNMFAFIYNYVPNILGRARTSGNSKRCCCASSRWPKGIFYLHFTADESVKSPLIASPLVFWIIPLIDILLISLLSVCQLPW